MQHPVTVMSLLEEEFLGRATDSTIGDIQCGFIDQFAPFACHLTSGHAKFRQPALQPLLEIQRSAFCSIGIRLPFGASSYNLICISSTVPSPHMTAGTQLSLLTTSAHCTSRGQCCQLESRV